MKPDKQRVFIQLETKIDDQGEVEYNTVKEIGYVYRKAHFDVLIYEEEIEGDAKIRNLITIQPDKATIKRMGIVNMTQSFLPGKRTETNYQHPHGMLHMETYTDSYRCQSLTEAAEGQLVITYTVKLNGGKERKQLLTLTYQKENEA